MLHIRQEKPVSYMNARDGEEKAADQYLIDLNAELEPIMKQEWELTDAGMARVGLRNSSGRKPQWKWDKKHGKLERGNGKGNDQAVVVIPQTYSVRKGMHEEPARYACAVGWCTCSRPPSTVIYLQSPRHQEATVAR